MAKTVKFYIIDAPGANAPHVTVETRYTDNKGKEVAEYRGYYPTEELGRFAQNKVDGEVRNDVEKIKKAEEGTLFEGKEYQLTDSQFKAVDDYLDALTKDTTDKYWAYNNNCVDIANNVYELAGLRGTIADAFTKEQMDASGLAGFYMYAAYSGGSKTHGFNPPVPIGAWIGVPATRSVSERTENPSPIALDLNGDGFKYTSLEKSSVYFDIDADGFAERVEWIDKNDGFLVRDTNKNGKIDSQAEMFGDNGGTRAYDKLKALDTNKNGKIDAGDKEFTNLRIWQDLNGNGVTVHSHV